jgi:cytochrome c peroxidase
MMIMSRVVSVPLAASLLVAAGCAMAPPPSTQTPRASELPPVPASADNPSTPDKIALGKQLFFDKRLSRDGSAACESCHQRDKGWTDGRAFSPRVGGEINSRHTPTMYNVGYLKALYWDGRAATLEANTLAAWRAQMGADPAVIAGRLAAISAYAAQFQRAFGGPPTQDSIVRALAAYLRTLNSGDSPWDRYEKGDRRAISLEAYEGYQLFTGKGQCVVCHAPPLYTDGLFHNIGLEHGKAKPDPGRFTVSKEVRDTSAFKTPTLRSVAISGPYFHDASAATLEEAVRYMVSGGKPDPNKDPLLRKVELTDGEIAKIVAFLRALTSDEPLVPPTLP